MMPQQTDNKKLEWFLSFLNTNLDNLTGADRLKLHAEMAGAFRVSIDVGEQTTPINPEWQPVIVEKDIEWLKNMQGAFTEILDEVTKRASKFSESIKSLKEDSCGAEDYLKLTRMDPTPVTLELILTIEMDPEKPADLSSGNVLLAPVFSQTEKQQPPLTHCFDVKVDGKETRGVLMYHFLNALKGVRTNALHRCDECKKWFLRTSARDRTFCSNACATKSSNRKRYEQRQKPLVASNGAARKTDESANIKKGEV